MQRVSLRRAGERVKGGVLFREREHPLWNPQRKAFFHCKQAARRGAMLADATSCVRRCRVSSCYTIWFAPTIRCRSAYLAIVQPNSRLPRHPSMRRAPAMPLFRTQSAAEKTSHAPHGSKARLRLVTTRRDSWRSHVHRTYIAQRVQLFKPKTGNGNLSLGGFKGGYSLSRKRVSPFCPFPTSGGENERGLPLLL